jgi:hypothetical protein
MAHLGEVFSLLYLSASTVEFSADDLKELLRKARENNSGLQVTGMLLFKGGNFLQVLEGEQETVLALYRKIYRDPRHNQITILFQGSSDKREFPDWSMGFHDLSSSDTAGIPGYSHFLNSSLTIADFGDARHAKRLLLLFKEERLLTSPHDAAQPLK